MPPAVSTPARGAPFGAVGLVALGLIAQDAGASFAVLLFPSVGAIGMVALRLTFSAVILIAVFRPSLRERSRSDWLAVVAFGLVLAAMNGLFYEALSRLPLGATVTIEVLGPLVLSVILSRRITSWLWAVLAFGGVALLGRSGMHDFDAVGVMFALGAGVCWVGYILMSSRVGARFRGLDGLALAMVVGAVISLPFGIGSAGKALFDPLILGVGLAVALLSSTLPYAFELLALRRMPASTFSILMSLSPAVAALAGLVILGQRLGPLDVVAIGLVVVASIGAVRAAPRREQPQGLGGPVVGPVA